MAAIEVRNSTKDYGNIRAVDDLSFEVQDRFLFALLGSNGAGKTTTISCLTTALQPSSGSMSVAGFDVVSKPDRVREHIGVVFQQPLLDPLLTVNENLTLRARLYGISAADAKQRIRT